MYKIQMLSLCSSSLFDYVPHLRFHFYTHPKSNEKSVIPSDEIVMSLKILRFYATVPPHYLSLSLSAAANAQSDTRAPPSWFLDPLQAKEEFA